MRCSVMSQVITMFYDRLYEKKPLTDENVTNIAGWMTLIEEGRYDYLSAVNDKVLHIAVLVLIDRYGSYFMDHVSDLYATNTTFAAVPIH